MRILIVEDEPPIADYIENQVRSILGQKATEVFTAYTLEQAVAILKDKVIDLCLLDLNLKGKDGFSLLKQAASMPLHTIIISAHTEQAISAFEYGVIDFIPKPFDLNRLRLAFDRLLGCIENPKQTKYLVYRKVNKNMLLPVDEVVYFKADLYVVNAHLKDGSIKILDKTLKHLSIILPDSFIRIHRSYLINVLMIESYFNEKGGVYKVSLKNGDSVPLSRSGLKVLNHYLNKTNLPV